MPAMFRAFIAPVILLGASVIAAADPILITRDARRVNAEAHIETQGDRAQQTREQVHSDELAVSPFVGLGMAVGSVYTFSVLLSTISDPAHIAAHGNTELSFETLTGYDGLGNPILGAGAEADSTFAIDFRLQTPHDFTFASSQLFGNVSRASLSSRGSVFFEFDGVQPGLTVTQTGQLVPDEYTLFVEAASIGRFGFLKKGEIGPEVGGFDFTFDLAPAEVAPTPEPTSLILVGTALVGLGRRALRGGTGRRAAR